MEFFRKYGTGTGADIYIPIIKRGVVDYAVGADYTPASGDVKISIDGGAAANIGTLPTAVAMGNTAYWKFVLADAELQGKKIIVTVADSATKAVEDQAFAIITFGHASAYFVADLSLANLPANVAQFGGTNGTFSGGRPEVNTTHAAGTAWNSGAIGASTLASDTITAAKIAADAITDAKVASDVTIASVTGAVGSVTGAVGSVAGNVGGNVVGTVASVVGAVGSVVGNVGGNVTGSVGSIATGGITTASFAAGAINAAAIAADAITDAKVASDVTIASVTGNVGGIAGTTTTLDALQAALNSAHGAGSWATATGFSTHSASDVWAVATRVLTAATNITSTGGTTVPQTGDSYARLGAPAGASVSADIAAAKVDTAAILDDTGTSGVVVASASKTGYALSSTGLNLVIPADPGTTEPTFAGNSTIVQWIAYFGAWSVNPVLSDANSVNLRNTANSADLAAHVVSDDGTTFTNGAAG